MAAGQTNQKEIPMPTETSKTVAQIAIENPNAAREFEKLGIDYCCGGRRTLDEACVAAKLPVDEVLSRLEKLSSEPPAGTKDFNAISLADLIAHINSTHHVFVREESPRIQELAAKVVLKHADKHPELRQAQEIFGALASELAVHLMKEEQILFPYVVRMEESALAEEPAPPAMFGTVVNPIGMMMREHDGAGEALRALRSLTNEYVAPEDACTTYKTFYRALQGFEADLHQHIHLENNVMFPRAVAMEAERRNATVNC
jgi:regulator of cell morphogenesis and NO signaling